MLALLPLLAAAVAAAAAPEEFAEIPRADSSGSVVGDSEPSPPAPALAAGAGGANITCCVSYPIPGNSTPAGCDGGTAYKHDGGTYHYNTDRGTPTAACGQAARCACCRTGPKTAACGPPPPPPPPEKLSFLSATLGSHMVLQRAPQQAVVWGFTAPGAKVTTTMSSGSSSSSTPEETLASFVATAGADSRRRDCYFDDTPFLSLLKHLAKVGRGGCSRTTVSPTARRGRDLAPEAAPDGRFQDRLQLHVCL
jgi:hypothetical protein